MDTSVLIQELESDPAALQAYQALSVAGGRVFIVGGAVRDAVLGKKPKDVDLMVAGLDASEIEGALKKLPGKTKFAGKNFGVYHYHLGESQVEIAMPRIEYGDTNTEFKVDKDIRIEDDLGRRDFTGNALAFDITSGQVIDPFDGEGDLKAGVLRLINEQAFLDDPARILRALVAFSVHGLQPDQYTLDEMRKHAQRISKIPGERIQQELDKLLAGSDPAEAFRLAYETGVLDYIVPELSEAMGFNQHNPHHDLDVGEHSLAVLEAMSALTDDPDLRLAALLHDLGKPDSFWRDESLPEGNGGHFYRSEDGQGANHEELGAEMARAFMKRLAYPNDRINRVSVLVLNHMFPYFNSEAGARKFINRLGGDTDLANDLLKLRESDARGKKTREMPEFDQQQLEVARRYIDAVIEKEQAFTVNDIKLNGNDLIALGVPVGPDIGRIKNELLALVLENPELNERDVLETYVRENIL